MTRQIEFKNNETEIRAKVDFLREFTLALLDEVKSLGHLKTVEIENGIDFDEEIKRFEIHLIEQALEQTGGNQLRAAQLLNLKPTTLHEKIKRFSIQFGRQQVDLETTH
jgi:transcriptional regulator with GAF, ATPase, and Fis domain